MPRNRTFLKVASGYLVDRVFFTSELLGLIMCGIELSPLSFIIVIYFDQEQMLTTANVIRCLRKFFFVAGV